MRRTDNRLRLDAYTRVADHQHHAVGFEVRSECDSRLGFLEAEKRLTRFDDRHSAAEACERLPELHANRAAAKNRKRDGQFSWNRRLPVRPVVDGFEAR